MGHYRRTQTKQEFFHGMLLDLGMRRGSIPYNEKNYGLTLQRWQDYLDKERRDWDEFLDRTILEVTGGEDCGRSTC